MKTITLDAKALHAADLSYDCKANREEGEDVAGVRAYYVDTIHGEDRRWARTNKVLLRIGETVYGFDYEQGLTENQDCCGFMDHVTAGKCQGVEYVPVTKTITTWEQAK